LSGGGEHSATSRKQEMTADYTDYTDKKDI
jgi:hypothetical protein